MTVSIGPFNRDQISDFFVNSTVTAQYGFIFGFLLGGYAAGQRAALQFLAENQHERPKTRAQALLYHRNKNYRMMAAFGVGGLKRGIQLASVTLAYSLVKTSLAIYRPIPNISYFDDLIAGTVVGSTFFTLANPNQRYFHFKKGLILGATVGSSLSLLKYLNTKLSPKIEINKPSITV